METHHISTSPLSFESLLAVLEPECRLHLSDDAAKHITDCRNYLDQKISASPEPIYGINTGFGSLYNRNISRENLELLQNNLVQSHAVGTGPEVPDYIVRLMLFLKVRSLSFGHSGVQLSTVERLVDFFNHNILPKVYEMGSLGASGDLAPLAHLSLPLLGLGEVTVHGQTIPADKALQQHGWQPLHLKAKEGLALLNGTQFMSAYGAWCVVHARRIMKLANLISAISLDAFDGRPEPFSALVHAVRPQPGQGIVAAEILDLLQGSELIKRPKKHVQDPYSFRCIPQVHGASYDAIGYVSSVFMNEINGVTDNPMIFPENDEIISAGNFHGQPLALALDFLSIALAELGSISERRTYQLISGSRELPHYLVADPGINSGLMIPQYTAASLVSQNKQLSTPASVDSIVSSNGQEDHVSMGANAALKAHRVVMNTYSILAIELLTASQALHFRKPLKTSTTLEKWVDTFRQTVPFISKDRLLHRDLVHAEKFLKETKLSLD